MPRKKKKENPWPPLCDDCGWRLGEGCNNPSYRTVVHNMWHPSGKGWKYLKCAAVKDCALKNDEGPLSLYPETIAQAKEWMPNRPLWVVFAVAEQTEGVIAG